MARRTVMAVIATANVIATRTGTIAGTEASTTVAIVTASAAADSQSANGHQRGQIGDNPYVAEQTVCLTSSLQCTSSGQAITALTQARGFL
jgi:hypothetical protein